VSSKPDHASPDAGAGVSLAFTSPSTLAVSRSTLDAAVNSPHTRRSRATTCPSSAGQPAVEIVAEILHLEEVVPEVPRFLDGLFEPFAILRVAGGGRVEPLYQSPEYGLALREQRGDEVAPPGRHVRIRRFEIPDQRLDVGGHLRLPGPGHRLDVAEQALRVDFPAEVEIAVAATPEFHITPRHAVAKLRQPAC